MLDTRLAKELRQWSELRTRYALLEKEHELLQKPIHSGMQARARKTMNKSATWKSRAPLMVRGPQIRLSIGVGCAACLAAVMFANLPASAFAQSACPGIHVTILNIRNSTGSVACALFESPDGFPSEYLRSATNIMVIKIRKAQARCDFEDIPPGTYAIAVIHDENMNGKLDSNVFGIPTEGYAFSKDAKALVGVPSFSAASFPYDGQNVDLTITLDY